MTRDSPGNALELAEPETGPRVTALIAVAGVADAAALAVRAVETLGALEAVEIVEAEALELVADAAGTHPPLAGRAMLLLEGVPDRSAGLALRAFIADAPEVRGVLVASDGADREELWAWCHAISQLVASAGASRALDVQLDVAGLPLLIERTRSGLGQLSATASLVAYASVRARCLYLAVVGGAADDADRASRLREVVVRAGGRPLDGPDRGS